MPPCQRDTMVSPMVRSGSCTVMTRTVKKWEVFPGKSKFLCDGRIVTGQQPYVFYLTCAIVVIITALFFAFDCPYLWHRLSPAIAIIAALLFIFVMGSLMRTSWSDPGIIPRATPQEAADTEQLIEAATAASAALSADVYQPPRLRDVTVNGVEMKLKYCPTCRIFRPPRASHCSTCDNCVERFDHHCPWVGNCIGRRNYRYFYLFLVSVSVDCVYICAFSVTTLVLLSLENDFVTAMKTSPTSILEALVSFFSLWSVIGLAGFHTFLAACNLTTNEDIKNSYSKADKRNPYHRGSLCTNYCEVVCGPIPPSLIDARSTVTVDADFQLPPSSSTSNPSASHSNAVPSHNASAPLPRSGGGTVRNGTNPGQGTASVQELSQNRYATTSPPAQNGYASNGYPANGYPPSNGYPSNGTAMKTVMGPRGYPVMAFAT